MEPTHIRFGALVSRCIKVKAPLVFGRELHRRPLDTVRWPRGGHAHTNRSHTSILLKPRLKCTAPQFCIFIFKIGAAEDDLTMTLTLTLTPTLTLTLTLTLILGQGHGLCHA